MSLDEKTAKKILVVDDDPGVRQMMQTVLERKGFSVVAVDGGNEALDAYREDPTIDLIILDLMMSEVSGEEVLEELYKQYPSPPPVLVSSAKSSQKDIEKTLHAGAVDFLPKPVELEHLIFKINRLLGQDPEEAMKQAALRKNVSLKARTPFTVVRINREGIELESAFPVEPENLIMLESNAMTISLEQQQGKRFSVKVVSCEGSGNKHRIKGIFMGLTPELAERIHKVTSTGGWERR